jgi:hypothetical protein
MAGQPKLIAWKRISARPAFWLGLSLVAGGLGLKRLLELTLAPDGQIASRSYGLLIGGLQVAVVVLGLLLLVRQPALKRPKTSELALAAASLGLTLFVLELSARLWLAYLATPAQRDRFTLFTNLAPADYAFTPHPYLGVSPHPQLSQRQHRPQRAGFSQR